MITLMIFLIGCSNVAEKEEDMDISEIIEKGKVEIAGTSYDLFLHSVITYKYDGDNLIEESDDSHKILSFYEESQLSKQEIYSGEKLIASNYYTYDESGKEIRKENVIEPSKAQYYKTTTYDKNYKETSSYDPNDQLSSVSEYELNDNGQIIKDTAKSKEGTITSVSYYEYEGDNLVYHKLTDGDKVIRETFYKYNEFGDKVSYIAITFGDRSSLDAMYYDNEYVDSKLVKQTAYIVNGELDEEEVKGVVKNLK